MDEQETDDVLEQLGTSSRRYHSKTSKADTMAQELTQPPTASVSFSARVVEPAAACNAKRTPLPRPRKRQLGVCVRGLALGNALEDDIDDVRREKPLRLQTET